MPMWSSDVPPPADGDRTPPPPAPPFAAPRAVTPEPFAMPAPSPTSLRPPDRRRVRTTSAALPQLPAVAEPDTEGESDNPYAPPHRRPFGPVPPQHQHQQQQQQHAPRSYADGPQGNARWTSEPEYSDAPAGHAARFTQSQAQSARLPRRMSVASLGPSEPAQEWLVPVSEDGGKQRRRRSRSATSAYDEQRRSLPARPLTVAERLEPTIEMAKMKRDKIAKKGMLVSTTWGF